MLYDLNSYAVVKDKGFTKEYFIGLANQHPCNLTGL